MWPYLAGRDLQYHSGYCMLGECHCRLGNIYHVAFIVVGLGDICSFWDLKSILSKVM